MADVTQHSLMQEIDAAQADVVSAIGHPLGQQKESGKVSFREGSLTQFAPVDEATMSAFLEKLRSGERPAASQENHASHADNQSPAANIPGQGKGPREVS